MSPPMWRSRDAEFFEEEDGRGEPEAWSPTRERSRSPPSRRRQRTPPAKRGQRWWSTAEREGDGTDGKSFIGVVSGLDISVRDRGRILGDRGSNVRRIVQILRETLGHDEDEHGRPPFVNFGQRNGKLQFELELYPPFNDRESFEICEPTFRGVVKEIVDAPFQPDSRHCFRPKVIQADDWECPNRDCGNLCFARRKECPLCKTPKPRSPAEAPPSAQHNVPDSSVEEGVSRPPKHRMRLISTAERLQEPREGECRVVWLVPLENRGYVIGKDGETANRIRDEWVTMNLTQQPEVAYVEGHTFCMAYLTGAPECIKKGLAIIKYHGGGCLARDGFESLLDAVEYRLKFEGDWCPLMKLMGDRYVASHLRDAKMLMRGAGLRTLMEVLEQWPEQFVVKRTGNQGATVALRGLIGEPEAKQEPEEDPWRGKAEVYNAFGGTKSNRNGGHESQRRDRR